MKFTVVYLFAVSAIVYVYGRPQDHYTDKYDNIDVDKILNNDRLLKRYIDCILDKVDIGCPPETLEIKKNLSEALRTDCEKCTNQQIKLVDKTIQFLILNKRSMWDEVIAKYDPERIYAPKFEDKALNKQRISLLETRENSESAPNRSQRYGFLPGVSEPASQALVIEVQHAPLFAFPVEKRADHASQSLRSNIALADARVYVPLGIADIDSTECLHQVAHEEYKSLLDTGSNYVARIFLDKLCIASIWFTTMRHLVVALITTCTLSFIVVLADEVQYTTKYDNIDVDAVINSDRLLNGYVGCLLDRTPCTPDAAELKKNLPDALEHDCAGCSEIQKNAADKISHHLIDNKPDDWKLLEDKYDPTGAYRRRYLENKSKENSRVD
ncbi:uncharacterized protein LOC114946168 [Nylanderia fulva]|uniref:uncharacterized protein LOC114946168 n=1 Tax=Nylanderia fulva TaxID=613905 RepID=UPI0010FAD587|nr:uncharacterized protein LOC114946168 [Nylanderia fulva]